MQGAGKGSESVKEAGRKGGERTKQTHGKEFYSQIGKKGGESRGTNLGSEENL